MKNTNKHILIPGISGVIGRRLMNGLAAINAPFYGLINSGHTKYDLDNNPIITKNGVYITPGLDVNQRINLAQKNGEKILGIIDEEFNWDKIAMILDCCTKKGTDINLKQVYGKNIPVVVQGGTIVDPSYPHFSPTFMKDSSSLFNQPITHVKNVSCNATGLSMVLSDIALTLGSTKRIKQVEANLFRRYKDPEDTKSIITEPFTKNDKYGKDVGLANKELSNKISSMASLNPWESHHYTTLKINIDGRYDLDKIRSSLINNQRLAYLTKDPVDEKIQTCNDYNIDKIKNGLDKIVDAATLVGLPHGDSTVNLVHAYQDRNNDLCLSLYISQRWSSIPGTYDLIWGISDIGEFRQVNTFKEAYERTNSLPLAYGFTFPETKEMLENKLND